jgi:hypothetical protein
MKGNWRPRPADWIAPDIDSPHSPGTVLPRRPTRVPASRLCELASFSFLQTRDVRAAALAPNTH